MTVVTEPLRSFGAAEVPVPPAAPWTGGGASVGRRAVLPASSAVGTTPSPGGGEGKAAPAGRAGSGRCRDSAPPPAPVCPLGEDRPQPEGPLQTGVPVGVPAADPGGLGDREGRHWFQHKTSRHARGPSLLCRSLSMGVPRGNVTGCVPQGLAHQWRRSSLSGEPPGCRGAGRGTERPRGAGSPV